MDRARQRRMAIALALLVAIGAGAAHADLAAGVAKYEAGDYQGAIQEWLPLAAENDPNALFNLGQVYRLGRGVAVDLEVARQYYERAATLGHVSAQGYLGTLLYFSEPMKDPDAALKWWQLAAANGDAPSQYMLGVLYFNGDHVGRDWVRSYAWMQLAVGAGLKEAVDAEPEILRHLKPDQIEAAKALAPGLVNAVGASAGTEIAAKTPTSAPARQSPAEAPAATASNGWQLQLASLASAEDGEATWTTLTGKYPDALGGVGHQLIVVDLGPKGVFHRLFAGPFTDRAVAEQRCEQLRAAGQACLLRRTTP